MKNRKVYIEILNTRYEIIDTQNNITLADSFLLNKIGKGHGEAKLYIGNSSEELYEFWENFSNENIEYFILKMIVILIYKKQKMSIKILHKII